MEILTRRYVCSEWKEGDDGIERNADLEKGSGDWKGRGLLRLRLKVQTYRERRLPYDVDTTELLLEPGNINRSHCRYPPLQPLSLSPSPSSAPPLLLPSSSPLLHSAPAPPFRSSPNSPRLSRQRLLFSTSSRSSYRPPPTFRLLSRPLRTLFRVPHQAERRLLMRPKTSEARSYDRPKNVTPVI